MWLFLYWFSNHEAERGVKICKFCFWFPLSISNFSVNSFPSTWKATSSRCMCMCNMIWTSAGASLVLYSCSYAYNYRHYNFLLLNKCFTDKINLRKKSSKYISSFWHVLGTKFSAFALGGRGPGWPFSTASGHKILYLREKQHCTSTTTEHYICTYVSEQVMSALAY